SENTTAAKLKQPLPHKLQYLSYVPGDVVNVYTGVQAGVEIRYTHPFVVIKDDREWFVGVPITNATLDNKGKPKTKSVFEIVLPQGIPQPNSKTWTPRKHSVIQIDQIRLIDKERIKTSTKKKLDPIYYLKIEEQIYTQYLRKLKIIHERALEHI
ncbi:type II toxin-antitoxin system PemK/MazF family toxin, partial [Escherichia coli]|uniref:type II toxin-antitoxin system PemK/MazF family toxin n=1 Tax=Escherichia coli TaxID=562 RepID=UPI001FA7817B